METASLLNNEQRVITLTEILPSVRQLPATDKLKLIRILAEELDTGESIFPFEPNKIYYLSTPYNTFGVAGILMNALGKHPFNKGEVAT